MHLEAVSVLSWFTNPSEHSTHLSASSIYPFSVAGGALQIGKGIGKGIVKGDGKAVLDGFQQGVASAGGGLAIGAETAVVGAADGLFSAGRGLFSGVKSVGKGIGGAFTGKKPEKKEHPRR